MERCLAYRNRSSNALRASFGVDGFVAVTLTGVFVSRSMEVRGSKNEQSFTLSFAMTRAVTGCVHSNWAPVSKWRQCLQLRRSAWHFGHLLSATMSVEA